jgi:hypothetical protein
VRVVERSIECVLDIGSRMQRCGVYELPKKVCCVIYRSNYCRCFRDSWFMNHHCILTRPKKSRAPYVSIACDTLNKGGFSGASSGSNRFSLFDFKQKLDIPSRESCCRFWVPQIMARCPPRLKKRISLFLRTRERERTY